MTTSEPKKAEANPRKEFFVSMITRDIALEDCILDLIDNSVDGAWSSEGSRPVGLAEGPDLSSYKIDIVISPTGFSILDNCGGMSLEDAEKNAFSFGRQIEDEHDDYSIGAYGIGMKRAVFKIGTQIKVRSTYGSAPNRISFAVPIDVKEWLKSDALPWGFEIVDDVPLAENGVCIEVGQLTQAAANAFASGTFIASLKRTIARDYTLHLNRGLQVSLNGEPIAGWQIELRQGDSFLPMRSEYVDEVDGEPVTVEVIGGMAAPPPESNEPAEDIEGDKRYGWYVVCNGRIVLAADKTAVTGWGTDEWPQWHRQYSGFIGIVLFSSPNAIALPLTTTKRSVDVSSEVFKRARPIMRQVTRKWIDYTNQRKQAPEQARELEARATPVRIYQVAPRKEAAMPSIAHKASEPVANINYSVPLARLKRLAKELGSINMPYREVGLRSFEYTYEDMVGDD